MSRPPDSGSGEGKDSKRRLPSRASEPRKAEGGNQPPAERSTGDRAGPENPNAGNPDDGNLDTDNQLSGLLDGLSLPEQFLAAGAVQASAVQADAPEENGTPVSVPSSGGVKLGAAPQEPLTQAPLAQPPVTQPPASQTASSQTASGLPGGPMVTQLSPMFAGATPFLARFLPAVVPSHTGIQTGFCNLHDFLRFLHDQNWYGFLHAGLGEQAAYVLVYEGRTVAAAGLSSTGEQALGELLHLYDQGAPLSAYPLDKHLAHILSGVGSRAWKFNLTDDFTGLHSRPGEAVFYDQGQVVATLPAGLSYEGAFPAPLRPQTLILPRSLAGWAHHGYVATLRGRDAVNAITTAHQGFRARYGQEGLTFQKALIDGLTPAEFALRRDVALHDLEALLKELISAGYLKDD